MPQSSEVTGGTGFTFEDAVSGSYLVSLLAEETASALGDRIVIRVALQQASFGEPLDDLIVDARAPDSSVARLSLQVKRSVTISAAESNGDFREIVRNSWLTLQRNNFRRGADRYGFAAGTVAEGTFRTLATICEWARVSSCTQHFTQRFEADGNAGDQARSTKDAIESILTQECGKAITSEELHRFLAHFVCLKFDFLHEGATTPAPLVGQLRHILADSDRDRAASLWDALQRIANEGAGRSAEYRRPSLLNALKGQFQFRGAQSAQADLDLLGFLARQWLQDVGNEIGGIRIERPSILRELNRAIEQHRLVQVRGLPGTGKSAVMRSLIEQQLHQGPVFFLKADRLSGRSWQEFATAIGLHIRDLERLLAEIEAAGSPLLFVDGIDRIEHAQRKIVQDIIQAIIQSKVLSSWRIVATARDAGIEPLRNWLPPQLFGEGGIGTVDVRAFDDDEARKLADAVPALRILLFGPERVREIARRPFFASVLARQLAFAGARDDFAPQSEIDLIEHWWRAGGYDASDGAARKRQRALVDLAQASARRLGRPVAQSEIDTDTIELLDGLVSDSIVQEVRTGHTVKFAHDIFFEWAFFHLLIDKEDQWISAITDAGEPPILGRVVELLSQARFIANEQWHEQIERIGRSDLRGQWARAWLLGPLGTPNFVDNRRVFETAVDANDHALLHKLLVWFQAERTVPNPLVLGGHLISSDHPRHDIVRLADALGWPGDWSTWVRLLSWQLDRIEALPRKAIPDIVSLFEVWQNALAHIENDISKRLLRQSLTWLDEIEEAQHPRRITADLGSWDAVNRDDLSELERSLRSMILRAARVIPSDVERYLNKVARARNIRHHVFEEVIAFAPILSQTHPELLADFARRELLEEFPEERQRREEEERKAHYKSLERIRAKPESERSRHEQLVLSSPTLFTGIGSSRHDWERLSIGREHRGYFPASPLREPFHSLFQHSPPTALALVRDVTNHAITAWRQLHNLDHEREGTPIPITLSFPWGRQEFWGDIREYLWGRGWWGPQAVKCALLALEGWALRELENDRAVDEVIKTVLDGHQSISVLAIGVGIAIHKKHVSEATFPLITCQRLWHADLQRRVSEHSNSQSSLIGFDRKATDKPHIEALTKSNQRPFRAWEMRLLVPLFVLSHDSAIRDASRQAIEKFPEELPFAYEEQRDNEQVRDHLKATAENWAEWGRQENYVASPHPEDANAQIIQLENPKASESEAQAALTRYHEMSRELGLWNWVQTTFEAGKVSASKSVALAVQEAKAILSPRLFLERAPDGGSDLRLGAVAGTAAIVLCYRDGSTRSQQNWARKVIQRALATPEKDDDWFSGSTIPWHPCIFAARALACEIKANSHTERSKRQLLTLAGHPLEIVSLEAIRQAFGCWEIDQRFSWSALDLGMRLSIGSRKRGVRSAWGYDPGYDLENREAAVNSIIESYFGQTELVELTPPPPPWVFAAPEPRGIPVLDESLSTDPIWRDPDIFWRWDYAPKVLQVVPVGKIMQVPELRQKFLALCDRLFDWTLERLKPSWMDESDRRERRAAELIEWRHSLASTVARIASHQEPDEIHDRFLSRIFALSDELCMSFLSPFVDLYICIKVLDADKISSDAIDVIGRCLDRMLQDRTFRRSGYRDGQVHGFDLPRLIRAFLFVEVEHAGGATRFANGDWRDIGLVMPIVDKFVSTAGWLPAVASGYLTLCERSNAHYPSEQFADQILSVLAESEGPLPGWRNTTLPARIAGLVQVLADRDQPLDEALAQKFLRILDALVDMGDRRSAAMQISETFRNIKAR